MMVEIYRAQRRESVNLERNETKREEKTSTVYAAVKRKSNLKVTLEKGI